MNSLRIGYQDVKITRENSSMADNHGQYDTNAAEIKINENNSGREIINTLLHEIFHAIWFTYGITQIEKDVDKNEYICTTMANAMTQVFLDNRQLLTTIEKGLYA